MKLRIAFAVLPLMLAAGCGDDKSTSAKVVPAGPVAAKIAPAGTNWVDVVSRTPEGGYKMGNPDAAVKLIEYGARTCPTCALFDQEGFPELKSGPIASGKLSYEFRDYPVHGALDIGPILLGHCVDAAAFFPMLDEMMRNQPTLLANEEKVAQGAQALQGRLPAVVATHFAEGLGYLDFVKQRGVPEVKARACLNDQKTLDELAKNLQIADQQFQISGTPTFIVNGKVQANVNGWSALKPVLAAAGAL